MSALAAAGTLAVMGKRWAILLVWCVLLAVPAHAAEHKGAAATAAPTTTATSLVVGLVSVPVLTVRKVRVYQYGIAALRVGDVNAR